MYVAHLADSTVAKAILAIEGAMHDPKRSVRGIYHLCARTACTPYEIALKFADAFDQPRRLITPILLEELIESSRMEGRPYARRPHYTILDVAKFERDFYRLPTAEASIDEYVDLYGHLFRTGSNS
jgi:dTDP-4-dehydrorhamnose reductase